MKKFVLKLAVLLFSSFLIFGADFTVFQSQSLSVKGEKENTLTLLSEVAYINGSDLNQIFTFYNPNGKETFNASFGIMPTAYGTADINYPLPFTFTIIVNGQIADYSVKINGRTLKSTDKISGIFKSGDYIPVFFSIPAEKKKNVTVQIKYNFLECSGTVPSYSFNYNFSTKLKRNPESFFKLFYINPAMTYYLNNMELQKWMYISKTDENEWTFDFDSQYLKEDETVVTLNFKEYPKYSDRELAFQLVDDNSLFFLTCNQLRSINELYRLYFYQLTDLQNSNVSKISAFSTTEYPTFYHDFVPGRWIQIEEERLKALAEAEAKAKAEQEARIKAKEEEEKARLKALEEEEKARIKAQEEEEKAAKARKKEEASKKKAKKTEKKPVLEATAEPAVEKTPEPAVEQKIEKKPEEVSKPEEITKPEEIAKPEVITKPEEITKPETVSDVKKDEEYDSYDEEYDSDDEEYDSDDEEYDSDDEEYDSDNEEYDSDDEEYDSDDDEYDSDDDEYDSDDEEYDSDDDEYDSDEEYEY